MDNLAILQKIITERLKHIKVVSRNSADSCQIF